MNNPIHTFVHDVIMRKAVHIAFRSANVKKEIRLFAKNVHNKSILEIGSSDTSAEPYFDKSNEFLKTDLNPKTSDTLKLDVTKLEWKRKYDCIVCINVLDDVYEYQKAVDNMYRALKPKGQLFLVAAGFYPMHDLPHDYFRFTPYSLRRILQRFRHVEIRTIGLQKLPSYNVVIATK